MTKKENIRSILIILGIVLFFIGLNYLIPEKRNNIPEPTEANKVIDRVKFAEIQIEFEKEKVFLLAKISKTSADSLDKILKEYYSRDLVNKDYDYLEKVFDTISVKSKMPKTKIAYIIYNFKYNVNNEEYE